jgi:hypothetical protein
VFRDPKAPIKIIATEIDDEHYVVNRRGEIRQDVRIYVDEHDMGRIRGGYACAKCYEVQDKPFPEKCSVCKFPMRDRQSEFIAKGYRGNIRVGPSTSIEDEYAFMDEWAEIQRRNQRDPATRPSQIWLPGS